MCPNNKANVKKVHAHIKKPFTIKKCTHVCVRVCDCAHRIILNISKQFRHWQRLLQKNCKVPNPVINRLTLSAILAPTQAERNNLCFVNPACNHARKVLDLSPSKPSLMEIEKINMPMKKVRSAILCISMLLSIFFVSISIFFVSISIFFISMSIYIFFISMLFIFLSCTACSKGVGVDLGVSGVGCCGFPIPPMFHMLPMF